MTEEQVLASAGLDGFVVCYHNGHIPTEEMLMTTCILVPVFLQDGSALIRNYVVLLRRCIMAHP